MTQIFAPEASYPAAQERRRAAVKGVGRVGLLAGNSWNLAGEPLLSLRATGRNYGRVRAEMYM